MGCSCAALSDGIYNILNLLVNYATAVWNTESEASAVNVAATSGYALALNFNIDYVFVCDDVG